jgi:hypothetical protein
MHHRSVVPPYGGPSQFRPTSDSKSYSPPRPSSAASPHSLRRPWKRLQIVDRGLWTAGRAHFTFFRRRLSRLTKVSPSKSPSKSHPGSHRTSRLLPFSDSILASPWAFTMNHGIAPITNFSMSHVPSHQPDGGQTHQSQERLVPGNRAAPAAARWPPAGGSALPLITSHFSLLTRHCSLLTRHFLPNPSRLRPDPAHFAWHARHHRY